MNWDIFAGSWKQCRGKLKVRWARFNDDHFGVIDGKRIQSAGMIQKTFGIARDRMRHKEKGIGMTWTASAGIRSNRSVSQRSDGDDFSPR